MLVPPDGSWHALPGTTVAAEPELAGRVVEDELVEFEFTRREEVVLVLEGQDRVVSSSLDGHLYFYFRVRGITLNRLDGAMSSPSVRLLLVERREAEPAPYAGAPRSAIHLDWRRDGPGKLPPLDGRFSPPGVWWRWARISYGFDWERVPILPADGTPFMYSESEAYGYDRRTTLHVVLGPIPRPRHDPLFDTGSASARAFGAVP